MRPIQWGARDTEAQFHEQAETERAIRVPFIQPTKVR